MTQFYAIIPAAGAGKRFGGQQKKQFLTLLSQPLFIWSLQTFVKTDFFKKIVVCVPETELQEATSAFSHPRVQFVVGGASRAESVYKGFQSLAALANEDIILIHDAVRPGVSVQLIDRIAREVDDEHAVVPALPVVDTIKVVSNEKVVETLDRSQLRAIQTPQGFTCAQLMKMYNTPPYDTATDEATLAEQNGIKVRVIPGEKINIKVTTPEDLKYLEWILKEKSSP